jgi:predicted transcriptional regulator
MTRTAPLKTAPLSIRIRPDLKAKLEQLAEEDRRSLAGYVELVLERHAEERTQKRGKKV